MVRQVLVGLGEGGQDWGQVRTVVVVTRVVNLAKEVGLSLSVCLRMPQ